MRTHFLIFLCLISRLLLASSGPFNAYVDTNAPGNGDSLTLTLELKEEAREEPDLSALQQDFEIISKMTSSQSSFINGKSSRKTLRILKIRPRGGKTKITIPAIKWGSYSSDPIEISQSLQKSSQEQPGLALVATANREKVYVNSEIIFNLELRTTLPLQEGNLGKPEIPGAIVETLVDDDNRELNEKGIRTQIFRRSYAIYPSKAGELVIPAIQFEGLVSDARARGWFSNGRRMSARSKAIAIKVLDIPTSYPKGQPFLPAKSLAVIESFDSQDPKFEVNKATTRRFEIKALGTLSSFLPVVQAHKQTGLKVYTETGLKVNKNTEDGIEASIKFSHVYMPTEAGNVTIAEQTIYWWDTDKDELKTTVIRPFEFSVVGDSSSTPPSQNIIPKPAEAQPSAETPEPETSQNLWWPIIAGIFACLWLATIGAWFYGARVKKMKKVSEGSADTMKESKKDVLTAARSGDGRSTYACLKRLRFKLAETAPRHPVLAQVDELIADLEVALYRDGGQEKTADVLKKIAEQISGLPVVLSPAEQKLSELYSG
jgi:hypothetical protein